MDSSRVTLSTVRNRVFITVDTEHSIGGAFADARLKPVGNEKRIFGRFGDRQLGIPLIMDIADTYGMRITFFVEVLNKHYFGSEETKDVCKYILDRGHDVQLHLHPNYLNFKMADPQRREFTDLIGEYPVERQMDFLYEGIGSLTQYGAPRPIAFRAGCFGANECTLRALRDCGFVVDSSYNRSYLGNSCLLEDKGINDLTLLDGIWELPITNFIEHTGIRSARHIPMDINGASADEMKFVLRQAKISGPRSITIIMHSFSFIKPYDVQYNKVRPRQHVISRFVNLCRFLRENAEAFEVKTIGSLKKEELERMAELSTHVFSRVPASFSLMRGGQQLRDNLF